MRVETLGLWVAIAAAIGVAAIGYSTTDALTATSREVDRVHTTIEALDRVLVAVGSAGSARRAFLLGNDAADVTKSAAASDEARGALLEARALALCELGGLDDKRGAEFDRMRSLLDE